MKLKFYRNVAKLTQKEVAAYLKVAESTYSLYENEKRKIGFEELLKLVPPSPPEKRWNCSIF